MKNQIKSEKEASSRLSRDHPEVKSLARLLAKRKWKRKKVKYLEKICKLKEMQVTTSKRKARKGGSSSSSKQCFTTTNGTPKFRSSKSTPHHDRIIKSPSDTTLYKSALRKGSGDEILIL